MPIAVNSHELAEGQAIVDARYDNDSIGMSLIDICGHGTTAALHAGLVKYATRAYASHGQNPRPSCAR